MDTSTVRKQRRYTRWTEALTPPEHLARRLTEVGVRPTPIRCDVLAILQGDSGESVPFTAVEVYRRVDRAGFSLANVYRILGELEVAGLAERSFAEAGRASLFSIRTAIRPGHLACTRCQSVEAVTDPWMQSRLEALAKAKGWAMARLSWRMHGLCHACATRDGAKPVRGSRPLPP